VRAPIERLDESPISNLKDCFFGFAWRGVHRIHFGSNPSLPIVGWTRRSEDDSIGNYILAGHQGIDDKCVRSIIFIMNKSN